MSEELIPRELLRHPDYASLLQEGGFPAVNTSFNHPTEGFDAIAIDFCDPANQPYVLRFYLRTFRTYYMAQSGISAVRGIGKIMQFMITKMLKKPCASRKENELFI